MKIYTYNGHTFDSEDEAVDFVVNDITDIFGKSYKPFYHKIVRDEEKGEIIVPFYKRFRYGEFRKVSERTIKVSEKD